MLNIGVRQDPLDALIEKWDKVIKEISEMPLPKDRVNRYSDKLEMDLIEFGWEGTYYTKYTTEEKNRKIEELKICLRIAIDKSINLYNSKEHEKEIDKLKNKKGIFDNATISFENFLNFFNFSKK